MHTESDNAANSSHALAYMAVALSGAFMGFWIGLGAGWIWWVIL